MKFWSQFFLLLLQIWQDSWPWNYLTDALNKEKLQIQETMETHNATTGCLDDVAPRDIYYDDNDDDDDDDDCDVMFTLVGGYPGYSVVDPEVDYQRSGT